jgi:hypothetical protein
MRQQSDPNGGALLNDVFAAAEPILAAIVATAAFPAAKIGDVEIRLGEPMQVSAAVEDESGTARTFRGVPFGAIGDTLAHALGPLVTEELDRLPERLRPFVGRAIDAGGVIVVTLDPTFGTVSAALHVEGHEPIALFTLVSDGASH